jgi:hypothetical protein
VSVDGIPVNMLQPGPRAGYADLHWLIPKPSIEWRSSKDLISPSGDFATSGAINIITRRYAQQSTATVMGGSYQTARFLGILSTLKGHFRPYTAFEYYHSDGLSRTRANITAIIFQQFNIIFNARSTLDFLATYFSSNWNASERFPRGL